MTGESLSIAALAFAVAVMVGAWARVRARAARSLRLLHETWRALPASLEGDEEPDYAWLAALSAEVEATLDEE